MNPGRFKEIREKKPRWGYKRVHAKLRKEGFVVNHKRTELIWRDYGFTPAARRRRKKVRTGETVPEAATAPNHVWTYDFMFDATFSGRHMKVLFDHGGSNSTPSICTARLATRPRKDSLPPRAQHEGIR